MLIRHKLSNFASAFNKPMSIEKIKNKLLIVGLLSVFSWPLGPFCALAPNNQEVYSISDWYSPRIVSNYLINPKPIVLGFAQQKIVVPLKRAGRIFMIEATINNQTGNFIFDTGAQGLVLNKTYFRDYVVNEEGAANGITGRTSQSGWTLIQNFSFSGILYSKIRADIADLRHIENKKGVKVLGLLGFGMLKDFEIMIDLKHSQLEIRTTNEPAKSIDSLIANDLIQIENHHPVVIVEGQVKNKKLRFCLDTGAETNVLCSTTSSKVLNTVNVKRSSSLSGGGSQTEDVLFGSMNEFMFNNNQMNGMDVIVTNLDYLSDAYGTHIDGMLGYSFLVKGKAYINYSKGTFAFTPFKSLDE